MLDSSTLTFCMGFAIFNTSKKNTLYKLSNAVHPHPEASLSQKWQKGTLHNLPFSSCIKILTLFISVH